jgi:hypothetical protein
MLFPITDELMKKLDTSDFAIVGLALLAASQFWLLGSRQSVRGKPANPWFGVGDTIRSIRGLNSQGERSGLPIGEPTVLLVFRSDCGHCRTVMPIWRDWIEDPENAIRTVAVTSEPLDRALPYVSERLPGIELLSVPEGHLRGPTFALTARTPWIFLLDKDGVILAHGEGSRIASLRTLLLKRSAQPSGG